MSVGRVSEELGRFKKMLFTNAIAKTPVISECRSTFQFHFFVFVFRPGLGKRFVAGFAFEAAASGADDSKQVFLNSHAHDGRMCAEKETMSTQA